MNWRAHHQWNSQLIQCSNFSRAILQFIRKLRIRRHTELHFSGIDQTSLFLNSSPLDIKGVIYVIIHIPSSRLYVGQTINSSFDRLKTHWSTRFTSDARNQDLHSAMSKASSVKDYIIWPLEIIPLHMYTINGTRSHSHFRRIACVSETYWINKLKSLAPKGFKIVHSNECIEYAK
jgi:hypothetical protein